LHCRPSAKVNWQREAEGVREVLRSGSSLRTPILVGSASLSEGLLAVASGWRCGLSWEITDFKKEAGLGPLGGSFAVAICNVIGKVNCSQLGYYVDNCEPVENIALLRLYYAHRPKRRDDVQTAGEVTVAARESPKSQSQTFAEV